MRKKIKIALLVITALIILTPLLVQVILQKQLKTILNTTVVPQAEEMLKVDINLGHASVNMFGGSLDIAGFTMGNPDSFEEPTFVSVDRCTLDLGVMSALRGIINLKEVTLQNGKITIIRNKQNQINAQEISNSIPGTEEADKDPELPKEPGIPEKTTPLELPKAVLGELLFDAVLQYIDHNLGEDVFNIAVGIKVSAHNITTIGDKNSEWGTINISGNLVGKPDVFVTDIKSKIAPITDPMKPSFETRGTIMSIDLTTNGMGQVAQDLDIQCDSAEISINIVCVDGFFQKDKTIINLKLHNVAPAGKLAKKLKGMPAIPVLTVPVRIGGTFAQPKPDNLPKAIMEALLANFGANANAIMDIVGKQTKGLDDNIKNELNKIDKEKINKGIDKLNKGIKNLFKKPGRSNEPKPGDSSQ